MFMQCALMCWPFTVVVTNPGNVLSDRSILARVKSSPQWLTLLVAAFFVVSIVGSVWLVAFDGLTVVQQLLVALNNRVEDANNNLLWLAAYALLCLVSQLLIVPSGSLILIAAGFIFSPLAAAAIFSIAQILCSWPVYGLGAFVSDKFPKRFDALTRRFNFPPDWQHVLHQEGFLATVVLRLTPVIPSAAACLLASGLGIRLRQFILATIVVCWIRPLFFASIGGSLQALSALSDAAAGVATLWPLLFLFIAAVALFLVTFLLRLKQRS